MNAVGMEEWKVGRLEVGRKEGKKVSIVSSLDYFSWQGVQKEMRFSRKLKAGDPLDLESLMRWMSGLVLD